MILSAIPQYSNGESANYIGTAAMARNRHLCCSYPIMDDFDFAHPNQMLK